MPKWKRPWPCYTWPAARKARVRPAPGAWPASSQPFLAAGALRGARATDPTKARQELKDQVRRSLRSISRQASKTGSRALDTLLRLDATILQQGVTLISKEASELLDKLVSGLNEIIKRLVVSS